MNIIFLKDLIFCLLLKLVLDERYNVILPFNKEIPDLNNISPKKIISEKLLSNLIMSELRIGTEPQSIKLRI